MLIITDRTELDEQIEKVYRGVDEDIYRTTSGADLVHTLNGTDQWLMCSLVHKFGGSDNDELSDKDVVKFLVEIQNNMIPTLRQKAAMYSWMNVTALNQASFMHHEEDFAECLIHRFYRDTLTQG